MLYPIKNAVSSFLERLKLVTKYGPEIDDILREAHNEKNRKLQEQEAKRLNLCFTHRQEQNHSHFSEENCDYCKTMKQIQKLQKLLEESKKDPHTF